MTASYDLKLDRAELHLVELEEVVADYVNRHPYKLIPEPGKGGYTFIFTEQPDEEIGLIVGDIVYNIRSALDHVRAALVPHSRERSGYFPILFPGVWEDDTPSDTAEMTRQRADWRRAVEGMAPEPVAILMAAQIGAEPVGRGPGPLTFLNRVAVRDRHRGLAIIASALAEPQTRYKVNGKQMHGHPRDFAAVDALLNDSFVENIPLSATDVGIRGIPNVGIQLASDSETFAQIPDGIRHVLLPYARQVMDEVRPYVLR